MIGASWTVDAEIGGLGPSPTASGVGTNRRTAHGSTLTKSVPSDKTISEGTQRPARRSNVAEAARAAQCGA